MYPPTVQSSSLSHPPAPGHSACRRSKAPPPTGNPRRPSRGPLPGMGVPANWRPVPPHRAAATNRRIPHVAAANWRVCPRRTQRARARRFPAPLQAPGAAGSIDGEVLTNKSSQGRADAQRLVATRLLDRLHDPLGHFSRLQRIYPRAR